MGRFAKWGIGIAIILLLPVLLLGAVDLNVLWLFGKTPGFKDISEPPVAEASVILSDDGAELGSFYDENRRAVSWDDIPPVLVNTLISTEDERFMHHRGIDFVGLGSAVKDIATGQPRGGSTITQQLAKNLFKVRRRDGQYSNGALSKVTFVGMAIVKAKEWIVALKLEMKYSKEDILVMYLNTVDFGSGSYGIKTAAANYFGRNVKDLRTEEAAVLVGLLKATTTYNPRLHPQKALARRNTVIDNLAQHGHITQAEADSLKALPIKLSEKRAASENLGIVPFWRQAIGEEVARLLPDADLYRDGLRIHTTLDTLMQRYAQEAVEEQMTKMQETFDRGGGEVPQWLIDQTQRTSEDLSRLHCGFVVIEPDTRHVKAWVGDRSWSLSQYDTVKAPRQPGSTFKLFVYAEAMNQGLSPADTRLDSWASYPDTIDGKPKPWVPRNANGYFSGLHLPLKSAFAQSINSVAVKVAMEVGIPNIALTAHRMGIKSPLRETPALALGASDVNLLELTNAYCTVVDDGKSADPILITRIEDHKGRVLYEASEEKEQAVPYRTAFLMQKMLQAGLRERGGTVAALWQYIHPILNTGTEFGGKTGTTNNHSDAWFVGTTPRLVGGAWVGAEYRAVHFRSGAYGQGSRTALPIFGLFVQKLLSDKRYSKYHCAFDKKPKEQMPDTWSLPGVLAMPDTLRADTIISETIDTIP